jgi:glycopeptide antibiotics resistance protein
MKNMSMTRVLLWAAFVGYLVVVAYLVWDPEPTVPSSTVLRVTDLLHDLGLSVDEPLVEFGLNVLLFTPMGLLGSLVLPRLRVADWVMIGFVSSMVIEIAQKFFLPARSADPRDVVSNTTGALLGATVVWAVRRLTARRTPRSTSRTTAAPEPETEEPTP